MSDERFVVGSNEIGEIIVTDVETGNVYRYGDISRFFGLIRLLNEQQATIENLRKWIKAEQKQVVKRDAFIKQKGLMSEFVKELEDE